MMSYAEVRNVLRNIAYAEIFNELSFSIEITIRELTIDDNERGAITVPSLTQALEWLQSRDRRNNFIVTIK